MGQTNSSEREALKESTTLDLSHQQLSQFPQDLISLKHFLKIDLSDNVLSECPSFLGIFYIYFCI